MDLGYNQKEKADANMLDSFLKKSQDSDIFSIKEAIDDINAYIKLREDVHKDILSHAEEVKSMINNFMFEKSNLMNQTNLREIVEFKKKLVEMEEIKIQEKLNFFRDTAELKKELRAIMQELREKESKGNILEGFLSQ